jgi:hypothetical protein
MDGLVGIQGELIGHNLLAYCKNNPINMHDSNGFRAERNDADYSSRSTSQRLL